MQNYHFEYPMDQKSPLNKLMVLICFLKGVFIPDINWLMDGTKVKHPFSGQWPSTGVALMAAGMALRPQCMDSGQTSWVQTAVVILSFGLWANHVTTLCLILHILKPEWLSRSQWHRELLGRIVLANRMQTARKCAWWPRARLLLFLPARCAAAEGPAIWIWFVFSVWTAIIVHTVQMSFKHINIKQYLVLQIQWKNESYKRYKIKANHKFDIYSYLTSHAQLGCSAFLYKNSKHCLYDQVFPTMLVFIFYH